jgi:hypothetical protein
MGGDDRIVGQMAGWLEEACSIPPNSGGAGSEAISGSSSAGTGVGGAIGGGVRSGVGGGAGAKAAGGSMHGQAGRAARVLSPGAGLLQVAFSAAEGARVVPVARFVAASAVRGGELISSKEFVSFLMFSFKV